MVFFSLVARDRVMPGTAAISSTLACLIPLSEPNRRMSVRLRLGPIPVTASIAELTLDLLRSLRWYVMANR